MTSALKEVCQELDQIIADFFTVTQDLTESQHEMNRLIADGLLHMAKVGVQCLIIMFILVD